MLTTPHAPQKTCCTTSTPDARGRSLEPAHAFFVGVAAELVAGKGWRRTPGRTADLAQGETTGFLWRTWCSSCDGAFDVDGDEFGTGDWR